MYVCLSITGLQLKYTGLCIVYVLLARAIRMPSRNGVEIKVEDSEDRRRRQNESRCLEDG